jgi:uncharacterized membrane protein YfcA
MVSLWAYRREWDRRLFVILVGGSVFGILAGAALATRVSTAAVILMVGVIAAGFVALSWFRTWQARRKAVVPPPKSAAVAPGLFWGFWLGFTSFLVNAGAPPFQVYVLPQRLPPQRYAGVQTYVFAAVNLIKLAVFVAIGQVHFDNLKTSASLFPLAIAATFGGVWLVRRVQAGVFYAIVYGLTFALGLKLMFDGARGLGWL